MKDRTQQQQRKSMKKIIGSLSLIACLGLGAVVLNTGCAGDRTHRSTGNYIDDKTVEAKVKSELLGDPDVKGLAVNVEVNNGRVQLSGFVDSLAQKNRAAELARNVQGVKYVKNDLVVK
jgi:hyperosmotically inducible protein